MADDNEYVEIGFTTDDPIQRRVTLSPEAKEGFANLGEGLKRIGETAVVMTVPLQAFRNALLGDETLEELVEGKRCSKNLGCGKSLVKDDGSPVYVFNTKEEAEVYEMEFHRTGLCPSCLNKALTDLDGGEEPDFLYGMSEREEELSKYAGMRVADLPDSF